MKRTFVKEKKANNEQEQVGSCSDDVMFFSPFFHVLFHFTGKLQSVSAKSSSNSRYHSTDDEKREAGAEKGRHSLGRTLDFAAGKGEGF